MSTVGKINPAQVKQLIVFLGNEQNDKLEIIAHNVSFTPHHKVITSTRRGRRRLFWRVPPVWVCSLRHPELRGRGFSKIFYVINEHGETKKILEVVPVLWLSLEGERSLEDEP